MKPLILTLACFLLAFFAVEVKSSHYRGGTVSYRPSPLVITLTIGAVSGLAVVALVAILLAVKMLHNRRNTTVVPNKVTSPPAIDMDQTVNSYEQHVKENDEQVKIEI